MQSGFRMDESADKNAAKADKGQEGGIAKPISCPYVYLDAETQAEGAVRKRI